MRLVWCCVLLLAATSSSEARVRMVGTPVVYTNNDGGGKDELEVMPDEETSMLFSAGGQVNEAWWVPFDNIKALSAIHRIEVVPEGKFAKLKVHGLPGQSTNRVRIKVYADTVGGEPSL